MSLEKRREKEDNQKGGGQIAIFLTLHQKKEEVNFKKIEFFSNNVLSLRKV